MDRIADLLAVHSRIAAAAADARRSAFDRDERAFDLALAELRGLLLAHMEHEEQWLFPRYREEHARGRPAPPDGSPAALERDHALLRRHLGRLGSGAPPSIEGAVSRLDTLSDLEGVLAHHDAREAGSLKPLLDAWLSPAERSELIGRFEAEMSRWPTARGEWPAAPTAAWEPFEPEEGPVAAARRALAAGREPPSLDLAWARDERFAQKARRLAEASLSAPDRATRWDVLRRLQALARAAARR